MHHKAAISRSVLSGQVKDRLLGAILDGRTLDGNAILERLWRTLEPFLRTCIILAVPGADRHRMADLHVPVLEALRSRDADAAIEALRRHFIDAGSMLGSFWAASSAPGRPASERRP